MYVLWWGECEENCDREVKSQASKAITKYKQQEEFYFREDAGEP